VEASYWSRILNGRARRRRVLAATGGSAAAALLLAACGGGDGAGGDSEGVVTETEDTSKEAKRGGTLKDRTNSDISTMDVQQPIAPLNYPAKHVYSTLVRLKTPYLKAEPTLEMSPDFAESWETSPDGLTITMKLRQNAKWHNKPPVNGRVADASDVVASWNKYAASAPLRGLAANSANPQAPVLSLEATDARTVSIKLKEPLVYALELFASFGSFTGNVIVIPKETDAGFDIRRDMIGTGPYMLSEYQPSIRFVLKRNPDYWDQNANFIEQIEYPIIIEYAQFLSQLKAGNIHHTSDQLRGEDLLVLKRDDPRLLIYALDLQTASSVMTFGWLPAGNAEKSPFADERVRQAWSMSLDRAAWVDAMFNVPELETGGIPVQSRWNSALPADFGEDAGWLDPEGKDFGVNAKYYARNIEEAKKLLAAAGFANGLDVKSNRITTGIIADLARHSEAVEGMAGDAGFRVRVNDIDYATQYIPQVRDAQGQYEGVGFHTVTGTTPWRMSPVSALAAEYWSKAGATFKGFSTSGRNDLSGDPAVDSLVEKARLEKDAKTRKTLVEDIQRHLAKSVYGLINPGTANKFSVAWPALRNFQVYRHIGQSAWKDYSVWIDETKPPFTNA
jgi:peptide/nickel transport system substrate-binding protein